MGCSELIVSTATMRLLFRLDVIWTDGEPRKRRLSLWAEQLRERIILDKVQELRPAVISSRPREIVLVLVGLYGGGSSPVVLDLKSSSNDGPFVGCTILNPREWVQAPEFVVI